MEGCLAFALLLVAVPALVVAILARVRAKALQEEISGLRGAVDYLTRQVKDLRADIHEAPRSEDAPAAAQAAISSVGAPPVATPKPASPVPGAPTPTVVPEPAAAVSSFAVAAPGEPRPASPPIATTPPPPMAEPHAAAISSPATPSLPGASEPAPEPPHPVALPPH